MAFYVLLTNYSLTPLCGAMYFTENRVIVISCYTLCKAEFTLIRVSLPVAVLVIHTSEACTSGAFRVTHTSANSCNSVAIRNLVKIVKCLEFLSKVYSTIASNVVCSCLHQNRVISLLCTL